MTFQASRTFYWSHTALAMSFWNVNLAPLLLSECLSPSHPIICLSRLKYIMFVSQVYPWSRSSTLIWILCPDVSRHIPSPASTALRSAWYKGPEEVTRVQQVSRVCNSTLRRLSFKCPSWWHSEHLCQGSRAFSTGIKQSSHSPRATGEASINWAGNWP